MINAGTCSRWVAVCIEVRDHPVVGMQLAPPPARDKNRHAQTPFAAWFDLIAEANVEDKEFNNKGKVMVIRRGQILAGRAFWSKRWNWTENAVRGFLSRLAQNDMIEFSHQSSGHSANVITICNYDVYQPVRPAEKQTIHQSSTSQPPDLYLEREDARVRDSKNNAKNPIGEAKKDDGPLDGETHAGMGVYVNCETIRHRDFTISLKAIELQTHGTVPMDEIKSTATGFALQWATSIAAGKSPSMVVPDNPAALIRGSIQNQRTKAQVSAARVRSAAQSSSRGGGASPVYGAPHRVSPDTVRYAKPAE